MRSYSILVVDDEPELGEIAKVNLEAAGHRVICKHNGREAIEIMERQVFDLIILDLLMPEKDGIEVMMELRKRNLPVRIIVISGGDRIAGNELFVVAKKLGAHALLQKPFTSKGLFLAIEDAFAGQTVIELPKA